ncbi:MAG: hypothetical protein ABIO67_09375, partial [Mycobacteriales bacterium]
MTARRTARRWLALALVTPLAGLSLTLGAAPAYAAGNITDPVDGATFTSDTTVRIKASINTTTKTDLRLQAPGGADVVVDSGNGTVTNGSAALGYNMDTSCASYPSGQCTGRVPAVNGTWLVRLSGGATDSVSFVLRIPPAKPTGVTASEQGYRAATVTWRKGAEPDLVGWTLYDNGAVAQDGIGFGACSGGGCSTTVTYDRDGTGAHAYSLVAKRRTAPGSSETLSSARSDEASATLASPPPPPPPPPPSASPSSSPTAGSGSGGAVSPSPGATASSGSGGTGSGGASGSGSSSGSGGSSTSSGSGGSSTTSGSGSSSGIGTSSTPSTAIAQRRAFGLSFSAFGPKLGIPKLPPLPATQPSVAEALPDGTYEGTLGYTDLVKREKVSGPQAAADRV